MAVRDVHTIFKFKNFQYQKNCYHLNFKSSLYLTLNKNGRFYKYDINSAISLRSAVALILVKSY